MNYALQPTNTEIVSRPGGHPLGPDLTVLGQQVTLFEQGLALTAAHRAQAIRLGEKGYGDEVLLTAWRAIQASRSTGSIVLGQLNVLVDRHATHLNEIETADLALARH